MARVRTARRSVRQAVVASRKRSLYVEPDTDDEFEVESDGDSAPATPTAPPPPRKRQRTARPPPQKRSKAPLKSLPARTRRRLVAVGRPRKRNTHDDADKAKREKFTGPSDGRTPPWTTLPLEILRDIFVFASHPLHEQTLTAAANAKWLIQTAKTARAFALPALEAFYQCPPLLSPSAPHSFLRLLQAPKDRRFMDYNAKTRSLVIDVRNIAYMATGTGSLFDVKDLVAQLPQLQHLEIVHPRDQPPFRPVDVQHWRYSLFDTSRDLDEPAVKLKSWRWTRSMIPLQSSAIGRPTLYPWIINVHRSKPFQNLNRLVVCGFDCSDSAEPQLSSDGTRESPPGLAEAVSALPNLEDLTFISCDIIMNQFLERLPKNLVRLELTNCLELTSSMLATFLVTGGAQLKELVLNHNPALTLDFLSDFKMSCPRTQLLTMDLHYYSERVNSNDAEPLYDELLAVDTLPTWPSSLRHLELVHLQRSSANAAANLFRSLIESAADLADLRHMVLQMHINIPWRDRVGFRDRWIERLERVYLRKSDDPTPHLGSLRQWRLFKQSAEAKRDRETDDRMLNPRVSHMQDPPPTGSGSAVAYSDSPSTDKLRPRRSRRVAETQTSQAQTAAASASPSGDASDSDEQNEIDGWRSKPEMFIQGLCDVVDIKIDNQRPREEQWTEGDFLDSEVSGDEDWHEGMDEEGDDAYAW